MKLRVERITDEAQPCDFAAPGDGLNARLENGAHDFRLVGPLEVHLEHYRAGDELFFTGRATGRAEGTCARCLEAFPLDLDVPFDFTLAPATLPAPGKPELRADDLGLSTYSGEEIDLAPLVEEQAILALPTRALCREDCRGLCPVCGTNRNSEACACPTAGADPRLAVLRDLKVGTA